MTDLILIANDGGKTETILSNRKMPFQLEWYKKHLLYVYTQLFRVFSYNNIQAEKTSPSKSMNSGGSSIGSVELQHSQFLSHH